MKPFWRFAPAFCALFLPAFSPAQAAGPLQRVPNTTLTNLPPAPPVFGYMAANAFGTLTFTDPLVIASPPGETNRLFIAEQAGRVAVITNLAAPNRSVFLDLTVGGVVTADIPTGERGLLGLAFDPGYVSNRFFYVFYTGNATTAVPGGTNAAHDILARYQASAANPNLADPNSGVILIAQRDEADNHNAGDLHFGPDGYLYVSLGDEGGGDDQFNNSQRIDKDFFSGILRLDVARSPGSLPPNPHPSSTTNYAIPAGNPFIGATSFNNTGIDPAAVRTEFWAVGLRNPWRFSFDPQTGLLYCGDVGQGAWEEVDVITNGGNYGWAYREGLVAGPKTQPGGFASADPIQAYGHGTADDEGFAIIGGVVYRGTRISQLAGAYVFCDYSSGNVWMLRYDGANVVPFQKMFGESGIAGFGVDPRNGDVLMANQNLDRIRRVVYSDSYTGVPLPPTLADTGAFSDPASLTPAPGIVPYDINVPFWSDNAVKSRWFSVPDTNRTIGFAPNANWSFPTGTVWIKQFELELTNGVPASRQRLETRLLVRNADGVYGLTYRWGNSLTNAALVPEEGLDEAFVVDDGGGITRTQVWHYPARQECVICHTVPGGFALGFNTPQLNRDFAYGVAVTNELAALSLAGYFNTNVAGLYTLPALAPAAGAGVSLEYRVRSYLAANCRQCHQPGGSAQAVWDARSSTPTDAAGIINGPLVDNEGNASNRVISPGSLAHSMLLARISTRGPGQMPPLASSVLDTQSIALVSAWITNDLPGYQSFTDWQLASFGSTNAPAGAATADVDGDGAANYLEFLTGTDPLVWTTNLWRISIQRAGGTVQVVFPQLANRGFEVQGSTNLRNAASWSPLEVPANQPFFSATNRTAAISDPVAGSNKFYRVRVFAP